MFLVCCIVIVSVGRLLRCVALFAVRGSLLVGCWLLAVGGWLLVVRCWLFVVG